jgi:hypothetical protein
MATMGPLSMSGSVVSAVPLLIRLLHTCDETLEERLRGEIFVVLLKVFLRGRDHLQGYQFVSSPLSYDRLSLGAGCSPSLLKSGHDVSNKTALFITSG